MHDVNKRVVTDKLVPCTRLGSVCLAVWLMGCDTLPSEQVPDLPTVTAVQRSLSPEPVLKSELTGRLAGNHNETFLFGAA